VREENIHRLSNPKHFRPQKTSWMEMAGSLASLKSEKGPGRGSRYLQED